MNVLHKIRRFGALTRRERVLFFEASLTVLTVRILLRLWPVGTLLRAMRSGGGICDPSRAEEIIRIAWIATAQQVADGPCLYRSLAAQRLLQRRGLEAVLRIGGRIEEKKLAGHAWIEMGGAPVGDPSDIATFYEPFVITAEATAAWIRTAGTDWIEDPRPAIGNVCNLPIESAESRGGIDLDSKAVATVTPIVQSRRNSQLADVNSRRAYFPASRNGRAT